MPKHINIDEQIDRFDLCQICLQNDVETKATTERSGVPVCDIDAKAFDKWHDEDENLEDTDWMISDLKDWDGTMW